MGNEIFLFSYVKYILPTLNLSATSFSYNFIPAFKRVCTHYMIAELILQQYPTANVIVINGKGLCMYKRGKMILGNPDLTEPSSQIELLI